MNTEYAELHCLSNFSFQRGASSARELFDRALRHGYAALAITDECTLAGIVRAWQASKDTGLPLIVGSEMHLENGPKIVLLVESLTGYQALCTLITVARRRAKKGEYRLLREDFDHLPDGLLAIWLADIEGDAQACLAQGNWLRERFAERLWLGVELHRGADDEQRLADLLALAQSLAIPAVASGDVHMHARGRRALQDTITAIRHHTTVAEAGHLLFANGERHLRSLDALAEHYPDWLLAETVRIARRCTFTFDQLQYEYPHELVPKGQTATSWLRELTERGIRRRWPKGLSVAARAQVEKELALITEKKFDSYFLTVHDIVEFARSQHILCQGRGSAANSAVCYALGITELNPEKSNLLFERFISRERDEPPDIDVDFEHDRREEVIQYIFRRYGRGRTALTAVASTYHGSGALRDVAKVLGLPPDQINALADAFSRWSDALPSAERLREYGFDAETPILKRVLTLTGELIGFPRHLSQHPGGFVISEHPLDTLVPVENAAMAERTIIQWDKDDLDLVGLLKVDILALGMLSALRRTFDLVHLHRGKQWTLASLPSDDRPTYEMISRADTIGVFQIESRAQMAMLPRLRPEKFYDLVIEVAIVRPGPIQGDMVHPYLRRRNGEEAVTYPPKLKSVFERTLGVPLFQEQVMEVAIIAADYTPGEADQLRRAMAAWKRHGGLDPHRERLRTGMLANGYEADFADRIFEQIKGFGSYGFPESHAASFALLTYASCWLKCHEPAAFTCALINSWPMGFYSPDQLLQDARRHHIEIRPVDVRYSHWDCTLEPLDHPDSTRNLAIRLGLRMLRSFREEDALRIEAARAKRPFADATDLTQRAGLDSRAAEALADSGALRGLIGHRHRARWEVAGVEAQRPLFDDLTSEEVQVTLPLPTVAEDLVADYATLGTTLGPHPLALLRRQLAAKRFRSSQDLLTLENNRTLSVAGLVIGRQRPGTASGVTFVTLEDEFGMVNVVVWRDLAERQRKVLVGSQLLQVFGRLESNNGVRHLIAQRLYDLTPLLTGLEVRSRDFQ
ncbi:MULTISPECIES: error-prone DNA polymerase [Pseudomonas syringae group]|uniref:Error-prone DNA polymerase n=4 Tax=Pseudomonas syringae group TaxID=136849 RepID=A0AAD0DQV0_9PSED|nr:MULTISPECIES: error-prone DNA polymerase [Pseudomonas syringae group]AVB20412.1 error-prone DNA polymerase [Pseudomonas avellanae]EGH09159.1 error-prone DNA polymerase [Pseudomonas amygdali pv. morsprunorum str. M302280]KWS58316.1 DNA polymerase [Pseudomonas amygdali pv. morsprunorum]PHN43542.1 DNA polymerase [Pseudomonas avellanae]POC97541.1 error-prone DNA polymerase [Pseudomonas avellanae]